MTDRQTDDRQTDEHMDRASYAYLQLKMGFWWCTYAKQKQIKQTIDLYPLQAEFRKWQVCWSRVKL